MQIVAHVTAYLEWIPVPDDVKVTEQDIEQGKVKPDQHGKWLMPVKRQRESHAECGISEDDIQNTILEGIIRDKTVYTRRQAAIVQFQRHLLPHCAHHSAVVAFEVHDDGPLKSDADHPNAPDEAKLFADKVDFFIGCHRIQPEDREALLAGYVACGDDHPTRHAGHLDALQKHFGVAPKSHDEIHAMKLRKKLVPPPVAATQEVTS